MNKLGKLLTISLLSLGINQTAQAGDFRIGGGVTQWTYDDIDIDYGIDIDYTLIELGYDYDHIFGFTMSYGMPESEYDWFQDRINVAAEFGYEFGEELTIRPYGSIGALHVRDGDGSATDTGDFEGGTSLALGAGLRAAYKFLYINATYLYSLENDNDLFRSSDGTEGEVNTRHWAAHSTIHLTAGFKF